MAAAETNVPWSDETDQFVTSIDKKITQAYGVSLREVLLYPERFATQKDIGKKIDGMKKEIDDYFTRMRDSMKDQEETFNNAMEFADAQYTKIDSIIATKASLSRVPYMKPSYIDTDPDTKEEIFIDQYNNALDGLITKFVNVSNYVADISTSYKKYNIGSWLFSGQRGYIITVSTPNSPFITIDRISAEITGLVESANERIDLSRK